MRRPAQHRLGPTPAHGWAHPYTGLAGIAVFYNDGGQPPVPAPVPSPADLAARGQQQPPAPVPAAPPVADPDDDKVVFTQRRLNKMMVDEKEEGRRAAYRAVAEAAGLDPDTFDPTAFAGLFKQAEEARKAQLSEEQRRREELDQQTQTLQADKAKLDQERADLASARQALAREQALIRLGAVDTTDDQGTVTAPNLQDALAMLERDLRDTPNADAAVVAQAAEALKKRRPELFGSAPAPQALPPAPSGGPAAGGPPRPPVAGKDALREAARLRAEAMGLRRPA